MQRSMLFSVGASLSRSYDPTILMRHHQCFTSKSLASHRQHFQCMLSLATANTTVSNSSIGQALAKVWDLLPTGEPYNLTACEGVGLSREIEQVRPSMPSTGGADGRK